MEPDTTVDQTRTLNDLLSDALQGIVFGNGFLVLAIGALFVLAVILSRVLKGGSL